MRNRVAVVLALALAFAAALSACSGGFDGKAETGGAGESAGGRSGDAYALYVVANKALQDAEGYQADMNMTSKVTGGNTSGSGVETTDSNVETISHVEINDPGGNIEMLMTQKIKTMVGVEDMDTTIYMKDGYLYSDYAGAKTKTKTDTSELLMLSNNFVDFPEDGIMDQKVADLDGGKKLTFTIKGDSVSSYMEEKYKIGNTTTDEYDVSWGDMFITAVLDTNGNMTEFSLQMSFDTNIPTQPTSEIVSTMTNIKIGRVDIKAPSDLALYQEMNLDDFTDTGAAPAVQTEEEPPAKEEVDIEKLYGVTFETDAEDGIIQVLLFTGDGRVNFYNYQNGEQIDAFSLKYEYTPGSGVIKYPTENEDIEFNDKIVTLGGIVYKKSNIVIGGDFAPQ